MQDSIEDSVTFGNETLMPRQCDPNQQKLVCITIRALSDQAIVSHQRSVIVIIIIMNGCLFAFN